MKKAFLPIAFLMAITIWGNAQTVEDDFEGNGTIGNWNGIDCLIDPALSNPLPNDNNPSATVLGYQDYGAPFANVQFDVPRPFDLSENQLFTFKILVPSTGITGSQPNQVSLKLQDGTLNQPWLTQTEIIKPLLLDQWQTVSFDFANDNYINFNPGSPPPVERDDFTRVVIQVNGEGNSDQVLAAIDDFLYNGELPPEPVYDLIWADEFDTDGPVDESKWFHQTQLPEGGSWFNGEIQHYTNRIDNSYVEDGKLHIVLKKETFTDQGETKEYTSARLNSKFAFLYGRVEIRAKMLYGAGTWPALWMLGKNIDEDGAWWDIQGFGTAPWPWCGEIDIMEHWGSNQNYVQSATHTPSSFGDTENKGGRVIPTVSDSFHVYQLDWTEDKLVFKVDDIIHYIYEPNVQNPETWPFTEEQYFVFNIAVLPEITPLLTSGTMEVDYIRVYQESTLDIAEQVTQTALSSYPNPFTDQLTIQLEGYEGESVQLSLYTQNGALIRTHTTTVQHQTIQWNQLQDLKPGVYLIELTALDKRFQVKVVKQ